MKRMKRHMLLLLIIVLSLNLAGCKNKKSKETSAKLEKEVLDMLGEEEIEKINKDFEELTNKKEINISEIIEFIDVNIDKIDKEGSDKLILKLEDILIKNEDSIYKEIKEKNLEPKLNDLIGENIFISEEQLKELKDEKLKEFVTNIHSDYYKLMLLEDELDVIVDYDKLLKYSDNISEKISEYFSIEAININEPILCKDKVNIGYDEISKRLVRIEAYVRKYPNEEKYEKMLRRYKDGLLVYLKGTKETPVMDIESNKFKKEVLSSYKETSKNKEDITSYIVRKYLTILEENGNIMNETVEKNILSLVNEAIYHLEDND